MKQVFGLLLAICYLFGSNSAVHAYTMDYIFPPMHAEHAVHEGCHSAVDSSDSKTKSLPSQCLDACLGVYNEYALFSPTLTSTKRIAHPCIATHDFLAVTDLVADSPYTHRDYSLAGDRGGGYMHFLATYTKTIKQLE